MATTKTATLTTVRSSSDGGTYTKLGGQRGERFYALPNLKWMRGESFVSQAELATFASASCGRPITVHTIRDLECMTRGARTRTRHAIADALGVACRDLVRP